MPVYYEAQEKQYEFHNATADEVLYGGSAGGGKSYSIIWDAVTFGLSHPKLNIAIFRKTYPELEKSIILEALKVIPAHWYNYNKHEHRMYLKATGSILDFNYCQYDSDVYNFQSAQYDREYFDELTHFNKFVYVYLMSRCRTTKEGVKAQIKCASNPGNIGHEWVKKRFIEDAKPNAVTKRVDPETGAEYTTQFIPARLSDNKYLAESGDYENMLKRLPEEERRMLLEGDWTILKGQYFSEFRYDIHVVKPFTIPEYWTKIRCMDWGWTKPSAILWIAFDPEGNAYCYKELIATETTDQQLAKKIHDMSEGESIAYTMADPALWSTTQFERGESIAYRLANMGIPMIKGDNNRIAGWNLIHSYLEFTDKKPPKLKIFENCHYLIDTLPGLIRDENKPEDLDTRGEDHAADALRYGLMTKPMLSRKPLDKIPQNSVMYHIEKMKQSKRKVGYVGSL
jgi:PBSX family phage terminase large subunit